MASYSTKGLDHLGLVAGMNKELGIAKLIDKSLPEQSDDKLISYGQLVEAMILRLKRSNLYTEYRVLGIVRRFALS